MNSTELPPVASSESAPPPPKKRGRGCLWALLISFVLLLVLGVTVALVARSVWKSAISTYTATEAVPIPILETSEDEARAITSRAGKFFKDLQAGEAVEPLMLTAEDLNRLIASTGTNHLAGKVFVTIEGDEVKGRMSFSLDQTGHESLRGRHLNADVILKAELKGGELVVQATDIRANDHSIPGWVMGNLKQRNLADQYMNDPDAYAAMQLLESITVTNGGIVLTPKP